MVQHTATNYRNVPPEAAGRVAHMYAPIGETLRRQGIVIALAPIRALSGIQHNQHTFRDHVTRSRALVLNKSRTQISLTFVRMLIE